MKAFEVAVWLGGVSREDAKAKTKTDDGTVGTVQEKARRKLDSDKILERIRSTALGSIKEERRACGGERTMSCSGVEVSQASRIKVGVACLLLPVASEAGTRSALVAL